MNLHEHEAKELLSKFGIPIPPYRVAKTEEEIEGAIEELDLSEAVIKIQVHAGGRGKAGGVKIAKGKEEILKAGRALLGMKMVNQQTGPGGVVAHKVLLSPPISIAKEYYVGAIVDREGAQAMLILSPEGGMEIEELAKHSPEKILKVPIGINGKVKPYHLLYGAKFMGWEGNLAKEGMDLLSKLARAFVETDASLLEINPLVKTPQGNLVVLDAKLSLDDNALFRQEALARCYDPTQVNPQEVAAHKHDLAYVALEGTIGCMVNGAGLAMATMDIIQYYGGTPANFLDVGGSATKEKVAEGFKIILSDPKVRGILVNIFGGIMNCATIAEGIMAAAKELSIQVPLVVRMEGTNVEKGRELLLQSKLNIVTATSLSDGAEKVVKMAQAHAQGARRV